MAGEEFQNLVEPKNLLSGIGDSIYLAPINWFATNGIKKPAPNTIIIEDDYVFLPDKGFIRIVLAPRKNQLKGNTIGDLGLSRMEAVMEIFISGSWLQQHEQVKALLNTPLIVLCYDGDCPVEYYYNLGCECEPCYLEADFSTGYTHEGSKGYLVTLRATASSIIFYEGLITQLPNQDVLFTEGDAPVLMEDGSFILL